LNADQGNPRPEAEEALRKLVESRKALHEQLQAQPPPRPLDPQLAEALLDRVRQHQEDTRKIARSSSPTSRTARETSQGVERTVEDVQRHQDNSNLAAKDQPLPPRERAALDRHAEALGQGINAGERKQAARELEKDLQRLANRLEQRRAAGSNGPESNSLLAQLQEQVGKMDAEARQPGSLSEDQARDAVAKSAGLVDRLAGLANQAGRNSPAMQPLREALDPGDQAELKDRLNSVAKAPPGPGRSQAAGKARDGLDALARALEAGLQGQPGGSPTRPGDKGALERGLRNVESLALRGPEGANPSRGLDPQEDEKLRREAKANLAQGLSPNGGYNEQPSQDVKRLGEILDEPLKPLDFRQIRDLVEAAQSRRAEGPTVTDRRPDRQAELAIDPSKVPAAYRSRVNAYFQALSGGK
jgi:hypothetical protein